MAITTAFIMMGGFFMIGLYVAGALGVLSLVIMYFFSDAPLWNIMGNKAWETNTNFILIAIPLFLLMGELMLRSGMGERMYGSLSRWLAIGVGPPNLLARLLVKLRKQPRHSRSNQPA